MKKFGYFDGEIMNKKITCKLFSFTEKTLYNWRKENRPVIELIENYISEEEIIEFLQMGKISKLEVLNSINPEKINTYSLFTHIVQSENIETITKFLFSFKSKKALASFDDAFEEFSKDESKASFSVYREIQPYMNLETLIDIKRMSSLDFMPVVDALLKKNHYLDVVNFYAHYFSKDNSKDAAMSILSYFLKEIKQTDDKYHDTVSCSQIQASFDWRFDSQTVTSLKKAKTKHIEREMAKSFISYLNKIDKKQREENEKMKNKQEERY